MTRLSFPLSLLVLAALLSGCALNATPEPADLSSISQPAITTKSEAGPHNPPASCPVTVPQDPLFVAPVPYSPGVPFPNQFWYGSESLWTMLPTDGTWADLPHNPEGYTQKIFWWRAGYIWNEEPQPELKVTGERLDAKAPPLIGSEATNVFAEDIGSAMLVGVDFPTLGCWKITGKYQGAELIFVIWVAQGTK